MFSKWKKCFVTVEHLKLRYYKDSELTTQKGVIDFSLIKAELSVNSASEFQLTVNVTDGSTKSFVFRLCSSQDKQLLSSWIVMININMANPTISICPKSPKPPQQIAPINFWKVCHITNEELVTNAQTGDILLFTGK